MALAACMSCLSVSSRRRMHRIILPGNIHNVEIFIEGKTSLLNMFLDDFKGHTSEWKCRKKMILEKINKCLVKDMSWTVVMFYVFVNHRIDSSY